MRFCSLKSCTEAVGMGRMADSCIFLDLETEEGRRSFRIVTSIAELAFASEVSAAVACTRLGPVAASAGWEIFLNFLALFHTVSQCALCAHVRLAHEDVESLLLVAAILGSCQGEERKEGNDLHCRKCSLKGVLTNSLSTVRL